MSQFVKFLGFLKVLLSAQQHANIRELIKKNEKNERDAATRGEPWDEQRISKARTEVMHAVFKAVIDYHTDHRCGQMQGNRAQHKKIAFEMMKYVFERQIWNFQEFFKVTSHSIVFDGVNFHNGLQNAGRYFGIVFAGVKDERQDGGLFFMILFAVASLSASVSQNNYAPGAVMWQPNDVEQFFVGVFVNPIFGELVGMHRARNDEIPFLTAAANWMVYFMRSNLISKSSSKNRIMQLVEHLMFRKRFTSGGDASPGYFRLVIICYSIIQHYYRGYTPPKQRKMLHKNEVKKKEDKIDFSVVPRLSDAMVNALRAPRFVSFLGKNHMYVHVLRLGDKY